MSEFTEDHFPIKEEKVKSASIDRDRILDLGSDQKAAIVRNLEAEGLSVFQEPA